MNNKLVINTNLLRKESEFKTRTCVVEKAIAVSHSEFENLKRHPLQDNDLIAENTELMYCDRDDNYHCLLIYDEEQGDGLMIEAEGSFYARYAQYIPKARELVERHQDPEIQLTNGERKLLVLLNEKAERIAIFAKLGYSEFSLDNILDDLGCDFDEVKKCLLNGRTLGVIPDVDQFHKIDQEQAQTDEQTEENIECEEITETEDIEEFEEMDMSM